MKLVDKKELDAIQMAIDELEAYVDYYDDIELDPDSSIPGLKKILPVLKNIISKKDFKEKAPDKQIVYVEKPVPESIEESDEVKKLIYRAKKDARESIDPLFKYCVIDTNLDKKLYLTDDYAVALSKAKSLSLIKEHEFFNIYSIRRVNDGTYKLFNEGNYWCGKYCEPTLEKEFLHFDYVRNLAKEIIKL